MQVDEHSTNELSAGRVEDKDVARRAKKGGGAHGYADIFTCQALPLGPQASMAPSM